DARGISAAAAQVRVLRREVHDGIRGQGQCRRRARGFLQGDRRLARHAGRLRSGSMIPVWPPALLVAIDTEGDNQWDLETRRRQTFENLYALPRLHEFFARHRVRPTYVVTYPVARDPRSAEVLRSLLAQGNCEIG